MTILSSDEIRRRLKGATPGPWSGVSGNVIIERDLRVATACTALDAALIAAAPDLAVTALAALSVAKRLMEDYSDNWDDRLAGLWDISADEAAVLALLRTEET